MGDVNGDGTVGFADLLSLLGEWGTCVEECCLSDQDLNGQVDFSDLLTVLASWTS